MAAKAALRQLRAAGLPLGLVTNTTSRPWSSIARTLSGAGFPVTAAEGLQPDSGAFVTGLEQAAGTEAEVVGKPAAAFFATALAHLGPRRAHPDGRSVIA